MSNPVSRRFRLLPADDYVGWTPYAWLIYLPAFFIQPAIDRSVQEWALTALGTVVFLFTYFRAYWVHDRRLVPLFAMQLLLGLAFTPINSGAYVFFVYAASFASQLERTSVALRWLGVIYASGMVAAWLSHAPVYFWFGHGVFTPFIGGIGLHFAGVRRANARLHRAQQEIEHLAAVAERERIARDLHDVLGHTLSLIVLKSELASKLAERDPERAIREIRDVELVSRGALREVRDAIRGYRPTLSGELRGARALLEAARIAVDVDVDERPLPAGREEVMALALREAVTNVVRHSRATHARIRVWHDDEQAMLEVADDGTGGTGERGEGVGLRGMRERVEACGGWVRRQCVGGTSIMVTLPIASIA